MGFSLLESAIRVVLIHLFPYMFHLKTFILLRSCFLIFTGKRHRHYLICGDMSLQLMWKEKLCTFANTVQNLLWRMQQRCRIIWPRAKVSSALTRSNLWQKSLYFYSRWKWWIRHLIDSNSSWSSWNQWRNIVREMLMNVFLELCMQLVHLWCSQTFAEISECSLPSIHPSNQTCFAY